MSQDEINLEDQGYRNSKFKVIIATLLTAFLILVGRLFQLQIIEYDFHQKLSDSNRIERIVLRAERGWIADRNGKVIVRNRPSYQINILFDEVENSVKLKESLLQFRDSLGNSIFDSLLIERRLEQGRWRRYEPQRIYEDAPIELVSLIEEQIENLPGVKTTIESRRDYPYGVQMSHVLGYTGELSRDQMALEKYASYGLGERIGKKGIEEQYESFFRGEHGVSFFETDAFRRRIGIVENMPNMKANQGHRVITTIDLDLQRKAESLFPDSIRGAIVILDPRNGEILTMLSSPRIDPNVFSLERDALKKEWASMALDATAPLNNRATVGTYPPGSIFKFVTAIAGMEQGVISRTQVKYAPCSGGFKFGSRYQRCWKASGHGHTNVVEALKVSCNVFFYQLGLEIGMTPINKIGDMYGLGRLTELDLPSEKRGLLMDSVTYNQRFQRLGWRWSRGQILNLAIGQGQLVTPIQMVNLMAGLGNGKVLWKPRLVKEIRDVNQNLVWTSPKDTLSRIVIREETQKMVDLALEEVVSGMGGTGRSASVPGIRVGGKTSSAQAPGSDLTHAWFGAVAPLGDPEIAIVVLMESSGGGGAKAAPVAGEILRYYFNRKQETEND
jgi:penicillin-binding protein 2